VSDIDIDSDIVETERDLRGVYQRVSVPQDRIWAAATRPGASWSRRALHVGTISARLSRPARVAAAAMIFAASAAAGGFLLAQRSLHGQDQHADRRTVVPPVSSRSAASALPSCQIPVEDEAAHTGGFLTVPQGTFIADAAAVADGSEYDAWPLTWNAAAGRWVDTTWRLVAPDGHAWVHFVGGTSHHVGTPEVVDAHGNRHPLALPRPDAELLGWNQRGLLVSALSNGAWRYWSVDPDNDAAQELTLPATHAAIGWGWYGGSLLWAVSVDSTAQLDVLSVDPSSGVVTTWFSVGDYLGPLPVQSHAPGTAHTPEEQRRSMQLLAVDDTGHPVVHLGTRDAGVEAQTLYIDAPGHTVVLDRGVEPDVRMDPASAIADAHGLWILDHQGRLFLYRSGGTLQRLTTLPQGTAGRTWTIVGRCS
jgi:hypothetical protein